MGSKTYGQQAGTSNGVLSGRHEGNVGLDGMYIQYYVILKFNDNKRKVVNFQRPQGHATRTSINGITKTACKPHHVYVLSQSGKVMTFSGGAARVYTGERSLD